MTFYTVRGSISNMAGIHPDVTKSWFKKTSDSTFKTSIFHLKYDIRKLQLHTCTIKDAVKHHVLETYWIQHADEDVPSLIWSAKIKMLPLNRSKTCLIYGSPAAPSKASWAVTTKRISQYLMTQTMLASVWRPLLAAFVRSPWGEKTFQITVGFLEPFFKAKQKQLRLTAIWTWCVLFLHVFSPTYSASRTVLRKLKKGSLLPDVNELHVFSRGSNICWISTKKKTTTEVPFFPVSHI